MTTDDCPKPCHPIRRRLVCKEMGRRRIFWLRLSLIVPLLLVLAVVFIAKSGVAGSLILPSLSKELGVDIDAGSVSINNAGFLVLDDVVIRAPSVDGPGGQLVAVRRIVADVDWSKTVSGSVAVSSFTLYSPNVRVSEHVGTGQVNFASFKLPETGGVGGPVSLPRIKIQGGSVELCEHQGEAIRVLKRLNIDGELQPDGDDAYQIDMDQVGAANGLKLAGKIDRLGVSISLTGLTLDEWGPSSVPGRLRPFVEMLDVKGEISNTIFSMSSSGLVTASVHLNGVGITLPIDMNEESGAGRIRMREVSGAISLRGEEFTAEISGLLEDVPYEVDLRYQGLSADAPFHGTFKVRGYQMADNPDILPFLPAEVGHRLQQFAGSSLMIEGENDQPMSPTAIVDASVTLNRGEPGPDGPAKLDYRGNLAFTNGTAAYEIFPYPFQDMSGSVQFNSERIRIEEIRGRSHTGAIVSASGLVEPIGPTAGVNLQIDVVNVPLDDVLERSLGSSRGGIIEELFNDQKYLEQIAQGLLLTPERANVLVAQRDTLRLKLARARRSGATGEEVARIRRELEATSLALRAPVFKYRGVADLGVRLRREKGEVSIWSRNIEVRLPEAGLILEDFPLPIHARDVVVVLNEKQATLMRGSFLPVAGGAVSLTGGADLRTPDGETAFRPSIRVIADRLPIDGLLKFAVAPPFVEGDDRNITESRQAAVNVIDRLGLQGEFDVDGLLLTRPDGDLGFDFELDLSDTILVAEALKDRPPMLVNEFDGVLRLTEQGLSLNAAGQAIGVSDDESVDDPIEVRAQADLDWSGSGPLRYDAHIETDGAFLTLPLEQVVASVSSAGGDSLVWLRDTFSPTGKADIVADLSSDGYDPVSDIAVSNIQEIEADYLGGRLGMRDVQGEARVLLKDTRTIDIAGLTGEVLFDDEPMGHARVFGKLGLDESGGDPARKLDIELSGGRFDSTLAERVVRDLVAGAVAKEYLEHGVRGEFDAVVSMTAPRAAIGGEENVGVARIAFVETAIMPKWAEMTRLGAEVRLEEMSGRVVASKLGARIESITGSSDTLSATVSGAATPDGSGGTVSSIRFDFDADWLNSEVRALLPIPVIEIIDAGEMSTAGLVRTRGATLRTHTVPGVEGVEVDFGGSLEFAGAGLTAGLRVEGASGSADISFHKEATGLPEYQVDVVAESARAMGLPLTNARVAIQSTGLPRGLVVPMIFAESCEGVISGKAGVYPATDWAGPDQRSYETSLIFSGLKLNEALDGFASARSDALPREPREDTGARVEGQLTLGGLVGNEDSRRGSLSVQIAGGDVITVPGAMRLLEAGNLQLPVSDGIDYASVEAVFDGTLISVEGISLISKSIELLGFGTATWPDLQLDLRLRSKATRRIPVLSELLETIRDEFVTIAVSGTASAPDVRVESLPQTRRVIGRVLGFEESANQRRLNDLSERASRQRRLSKKR